MRASNAAICIVAALSVCFCSRPPAVQWTRTFDASCDTACSWVQQTRDRGFIAAGRVVMDSELGFPVDIYLLKTDSMGNTQWQIHYGSGQTHDEASCVQQTRDGGYVLAGNGGKPDGVLILKTDSLGNEQWKLCAFPWAAAWDIRQTRDGGYVTGGLWRSDSLFLLKLDSMGKVEWTRTYCQGPHIRAWQGRTPLSQTRDGGYIIGAEALVKTDPLGNQMWARDYERTLYAMHSVVQTADGGYIATGVGPLGLVFRGLTRKQTFERVRADSRFLLNWVVLKTDSKGNPRCKIVLPNGRSWMLDGSCVAPTHDGGYVFSGSFYPGDCLIRTNSIGIPLWIKTFDDMGVDCCQQTEDGGYILSDGGRRIRKLAPEGK